MIRLQKRLSEVLSFCPKALSTPLDKIPCCKVSLRHLGFCWHYSSPVRFQAQFLNTFRVSRNNPMMETLLLFPSYARGNVSAEKRNHCSSSASGRIRTRAPDGLTPQCAHGHHSQIPGCNHSLITRHPGDLGQVAELLSETVSSSVKWE